MLLRDFYGGNSKVVVSREIEDTIGALQSIGGRDILFIAQRDDLFAISFAIARFSSRVSDARIYLYLVEHQGDLRQISGVPQESSPRQLVPNSSAIEDIVNAVFDSTADESRQEITLSKSQLALVNLIAEGLSNTEIAAARGCTIRAVENLIARTMEKLGLDGERNSRKVTIAALKYLNRISI
jgi:DNA-binding CsgD family transcriptional regulator